MLPLNAIQFSFIYKYRDDQIYITVHESSTQVIPFGSTDDPMIIWTIYKVQAIIKERKKREKKN